MSSSFALTSTGIDVPAEVTAEGPDRIVLCSMSWGLRLRTAMSA